MRAALPAALLALALGSPAAAAGLFEANHPKVQAGNEAYSQGDYEAALRHYEEASKALPKRPELLYNLGDVYLKLGRTDDAKRAFEAALAGADDLLKARDLFNLGNAFAALNQNPDAIAAYRQALKVDPKHEPARRNLELLLRQANQKPRDSKPSPGDGGTPDSGQPDSGQPDSGQPDAGADGGQADAGAPPDAGADGGQGDAGVVDGGADGGSSDGGSDAGTGDGGSDAGSADGGEPTDGGSPDSGDPQDGGEGESENADGGSPDAGAPDAGMQSQPEPEQTSVDPEEIDRQKAEELLEALRRNEKQFLMHQQKRKGKTRVNPEKDW